MSVQRRFVDSSGVNIHCHLRGAGRAVVFLHGFPDLGMSWRHQARAIADAGFLAVCPDLRGYGASDRPARVGDYALTKISDDIVRVIEAVSVSPVVLVGHDWGGVIAWYVAMHHPERLRHLVVLNAPHPAAYRRELGRFSSQILRSWYAAFFQLPALPEAVLRFRSMSLLDRAWRSGPARDEETRALYHQAFGQEGAITAALNYYRAAIRFPNPHMKRVTVPVSVLWGDRDPYLVPRLAEGLERGVDVVDVEHFPGAGHWLHHDEPEGVNRRLVEIAGRAFDSP